MLNGFTLRSGAGSGEAASDMMSDKRWRRALPLACLAAAAMGLAPPGARSQAWTRVVQPPASATVSAVRAAPDGGVLLGTIQVGESAVAKLDASGVLLWQFVATGTDDPLRAPILVDLAPSSTGGATALFQKSCDVGGVGDTCTVLAGIDPAGVLSWSWMWGTRYGPQPGALAALSDGTVAIAEAGSSLAVRLQGHAPAGPTWSSSLVDGGREPCLAASDDEGFALTVWYDREPAWIARFDAGGVLRWQRGLESDLVRPTGLPLSVDALARCSDGSWMVAGVSPVPGPVFWVAKIGDDGSLVWSLGYEGAQAYPPAPVRITSLHPTADGGAVLLGKDSSWDPFMARISADGAPAWLARPSAGGRVRQAAASTNASGVLHVTASLPVGVAIARADASDQLAGCLDWEAFHSRTLPFPMRIVAASRSLAPDTTTRLAAAIGQRPGAITEIACASPCSTDQREPDDGPGSPRALPRPPSVVAGNFCDDAADWLRTDVCKGATLILETSRLGAAADTVLELFHAGSGAMLASDDDGGVNRGSRVEWTALERTTLLLRVRQADGTNGPDRGYVLTASVVEPARTTYLRRIGGYEGGLVQWRLAQDGSVVGSGARGRTSGRWAMSLDAEGFTRWALALPGDGPIQSTCVTPAPGGGAIVAMCGPQASSIVRSMEVARIDSAGAIVWVRGYEPDPAHRVQPEVATTLVDGRIALAGIAREVDSPYEERAWVMTLDGAGNLDWDRRVEPRAGYVPLAVAGASDGGVLVAGEISTSSPVGGFIAKFTGTGGLAWSRTFAARATAVEAALDGGGVVAIEGPPLVLLHLDSAGRATDQRSFRDPIWAGRLRGTSLRRAADGGLIVATGPSFEPLIFRVSPAGAVEWARTELASSLDVLDARELPDGTVSVVMDHSWTSQASGRLLRLSADGALEPWCTRVSSVPVIAAGASVSISDGTLIAEDAGGSLVASDWSTFPFSTATTDACTCECGPTASLPLEVSRATSRRPLRMDAPGRLTWEPQTSNSSCQFNLYRGDVAALRVGDHGSCLATDLPVNEAWDLARPGVGRAWFYLVTGLAHSVEGPLGPDSLGRDRPVTSPCP